VRVRILKITGADLNLFEFDYDLAWAAFFMNANGKVYGRYGGRDAKGADTRNSLKGLNYAMAAALEEHRKNPSVKPERPPAAPMYVEKLPTSKTYRGCIHCHQVKEILREEAIKAGTWQRDSVFTFPLPENVGITLDLDRGNLVKSVKADSAADQAGLKPGDFVQTLHGLSVRSFADAQYALHKAPKAGKIAVAWQRDGKDQSAELTLPAGWKWTNVTWRPSLLDILPSLTVYGDDLTAQEKKTLGLEEKRLAFRQDKTVHSAAKAMGVQADDVIIGIDGKVMEMTMTQFLGHVRQNYLIGDAATINLLRAGKRVDLKVTLK
jgi:membrane-associated protease RseP (regulator of RpoE activity)